MIMIIFYIQLLVARCQKVVQLGWVDLTLK